MTTMFEEKVYKKEERRHSEMDRPSGSPPPAMLTFEEANALADGRSFELIKGRMIFKMPDYYHARTQVRLGSKLDNYFDANPIGQVLTELTHRLWPENAYEIRVPDLSIILNEHIAAGESYPTRAPDIAVEIISSDDAWTKLFEKAKLYFERGSREVWLIDPYEKGVMVLTSSTQHWTRDVLASPALLPGFEVELSQIFTWPNAPAAMSAEQSKS